jgi:tyrosyl-tRNA synthetase
LVTSNGEGRRLVAQGAIRIDGEPITDETVPRAALVDVIVQVGKRRFIRFEVQN